MHFVVETRGGDARCLAEDAAVLERGGAVAVVGWGGGGASGGGAPPLCAALETFVALELRVVGVCLEAASDEELRAAAAVVWEGLNGGELQPLVGRVFAGLGAAGEAREWVAAGHGGGGRGGAWWWT